MEAPEMYVVVELGEVQTDMGPAVRIHVERKDRAVMGFRELWEVFERAYPGRWAVQLFPPRNRLFDQVNRYHLYVLERQPLGIDLFDSAPPRSK